MFVDFLVN